MHTPGVNAFFHMAPMAGLQWLRVFVCMVIVYAVVEVEKALVDPLLMPMIKPVLRFLEARTPLWLSVDKPLSARLARVCGGKHLKHTASYTTQRRGKYKRAAEQKKAAAAAAAAANMDAGGSGEQVVQAAQQQQLETRQLSAVIEHSRPGSSH